MATDLVTGNLGAKLNSSITDTDTSMTVNTDYSGKTVSDEQYLAIGDNYAFQNGTYEVVKYTSWTNNGDGTSTFSGLSRGLDNTTAQSWSSGVSINASLPGPLLTHLPKQLEALDMNSSQVFNLPLPASASDAASKEYVDAQTQGLDLKDAVRVASTSNIDLTSSSDPSPVDGVTLSNNDRVLLKSQTNAYKNGIYKTVTATDPTSWIRVADADNDEEVNSGMFTFVTNGNTYANQGWVLTTEDPITVDTTDLSFAQFSGAGSIIAGTALSKSGDTINHGPASVHENGGSVEITHNNLTLSSDDHHTKTTSSDINLGSLGSYDAGGNSITNVIIDGGDSTA